MEMQKMSGPNQKKPGGKKRGKQSPKPNQSNQLADQKPVQLHSLPPEPLRSRAPEPLRRVEPQPSLSVAADQRHAEMPEQPCNKEQAGPAVQVAAEVASAEIPAIDFQTIATAYGNYTKRSFAETKAYVEKLSGVRSIDKIVEIQTEFAKQAYDTFVAESKKIHELYSGLAKQNLRPFEGFVARKSRAAH
jgi:hypothetical protein